MSESSPISKEEQIAALQAQIDSLTAKLTASKAADPSGKFTNDTLADEAGIEEEIATLTEEKEALENS